MIRTKDAHDWSAEQHEAAAAALGSFVADGLRMGSYGRADGFPDTIGRVMDQAFAQALRWAAVDAASHAHAAERERELQAAFLAGHPGTVFEVCAWCPPDIRKVAEAAGRASGLPISHGCCPSCTAQQLAQLSPLDARD